MGIHWSLEELCLAREVILRSTIQWLQVGSMSFDGDDAFTGTTGRKGKAHRAGLSEISWKYEAVGSTLFRSGFLPNIPRDVMARDRYFLPLRLRSSN